MIHSLIIKGIFEGVGSVLSFLPIIVVMFFFLSMLEDSGYIAGVKPFSWTSCCESWAFPEAALCHANRLRLYRARGDVHQDAAR